MFKWFVRLAEFNEILFYWRQIPLFSTKGITAYRNVCKQDIIENEKF